GAIRDYFFKSGDEETARLIENDWLMSKDRRTHTLSPHFSLNAEDQQFFQERILLRPNDPTRLKVKPITHRASHKRIERAAVIAADFVKDTIVTGLPAGKEGDALHRWL